MKKRYIYMFVFGVPGLFVAGLFSALVLGAFSGILWLFVFGDSPWPAFAQAILSTLFVLVFIVLWAALILLGYWVGKGREKDPALNRSHILISAGVTLLCILLMLVYQWRVGNIGPQPDSALCSEFCARHGFSASSMPPAQSGARICSCYDDSGNETLRIPLDHLVPGFSE